MYRLGTGIASLLRLGQQYARIRPLHIICSSQQAEDNYYQQILNQLREAGVTVDLQSHRFTKNQLIKAVGRDELSNGEVLIVGSSEEVLKVRKTLRQIGFSRQQLHD